MKKYLLLLSVSLGLTACGETTQNSITSSTPATTNSASTVQDNQNLPLIKISAKELGKAYEENEAAADDKYKDKQLEVKGVINMIDKNITDNVTLQLIGANQFTFVIANLTPEAEKIALTLKKKQQVTVTCIGGGEIMSMPVLNDCTIKSTTETKGKKK